VLLLHNHLGEWYAVCHDHETGEVRDFHAGRIINISDTRCTFTPPESFDPDEYLRRGFGMFRGGKDVLVEVKFDQYQARYARERAFHPTQRREELPDGRLHVTFETTEAALEQVARWLMQYGEHVRAVRPPSLRSMMRERLKRAAALYDKTTDETNDE
jgi:predicted DNA-binding transcriptional regulator YafY